jgi:hypothetical protein
MVRRDQQHVVSDYHKAQRSPVRLRERRNRPRRRDEGRPAAAVRLPQRRVRNLQGAHPRRRRRLRRLPVVDVDRRRQAHGARAVLLRAPAHRPHDRSARGAPRRRHPDQAPAMPHRDHRQACGRCRDRAHQAAGQRAPAVPRRTVHRLPAQGWQAPQLFTRGGSARRRAARAAHPAHRGRPVHRPVVLDVPRPRDPAHRGPARRVLPARGVGQADDFRGRRHRLRANQGDARTLFSPRHRPADGAVLGRTHARWPVHAAPARAVADGARQFHVHPGAVRHRSRRRVARPQGIRAPGGARRFPRSVGLPGVRVRCPNQGDARTLFSPRHRR